MLDYSRRRVKLLRLIYQEESLLNNSRPQLRLS